MPKPDKKQLNEFAKEILGKIRNITSCCDNCKYCEIYVELTDNCLLAQIADNLHLIKQLTEPKEYAVWVGISKVKILVYGPVTKEECDIIASKLKNVEVLEYTE